MNSVTPGKRLLWNEPRVVLLCGFSLLVTCVITLWQMKLRHGIIDPEAVAIFDRLFLFTDYVASFCFLASLLLAMTPALQRAGLAAARWVGLHPASTAGLSFLVLAWGTRFLYHAHPLAMDESAPYMQSAIFAAGSLFGRMPPELLDWLVFPAFQGFFIYVSHQTGLIAETYWPGFALLMAPFMAIGVPWLCNPTLGAATVWVIHRLALGLTDSVETAGTAVMFAFASAAFFVNSISFYSMTAHLLCNAVFVLLLLLRPSFGRALAAGCIGGLALTLHNPVPHILFAAPWVFWITRRPRPWRIAMAMLLGYLPWVVIVGFGWRYLMMSHVAPPADIAADVLNKGPVADALGLLGKVASWPDAAVLQARLVSLAKLWLWAVPAVLPLALVGLWQHRGDLRFRLLFGSAALTFIGFLFIPVTQGHGWGFRYFHSAWFVIPLLAASAGGAINDRDSGTHNSCGGLRRFVQGAAISSLLVMLPFFGLQVRTFIGDHLAQLPQTDTGTPKVVIINPYLGYYAQDLVQNDPFLRAPVIRMVTHGRERDEEMLRQHFPDLIRLSSDFRGSVWGYADENSRSAHLDLRRTDQHREQERTEDDIQP